LKDWWPDVETCSVQRVPSQYRSIGKYVYWMMRGYRMIVYGTAKNPAAPAPNIKAGTATNV